MSQSRSQELFDDILSYKYDPAGFVMYTWPWGEKGTPLEKIQQPRSWQMDEFVRIRDQLINNRQRIKIGLMPEPIYIALSSGRGIGKSAFLSMLNYWVASCWLGGTSIVTANTETQLRSRTMAELGKWHTMAINRDWFEKTTTSLRPARWFGDLLKNQLKMDTQYYYVDAQSWSEENPDAFAGAHSQIAMCVTYDEASGIPDSIWHVTEGFFTDEAELRIWTVISNPRRNTGMFFECFHKNRDYWHTRMIDSRTVEGVDAAVYQRIVDQNGEDSDVARVEVKGEFPRTGSNQFIGRELVIDAQSREVTVDEGEPLVMGVDVARFGDDSSVIAFRQGRDARSIPFVKYKGVDTMTLANRVAELIEKYRPDAVFIDGGGVGGGVVDRLRQMKFKVIEVQSGEKSLEPDKYINKRVEMWDKMRQWLEYGALPDSSVLVDDLTGPEYELDLRNRIKLETKENMKKRGLASPDEADALGLTFAQPVNRRDMQRMRPPTMFGLTKDADFDPFDY